ncbi:thioredoxin [Pseudomonas tolaasii]|uniref:thioredoxin n=1 Tax=Pseudomonas tolaasii TaxID=29442 RepID=UPI0015A2445A|nr:thioredoxin [Pseudomonas tolaasii]NVZ45172.1 thioredoxin [Pseudomonas tolaasii]NWA48848.1 thioredoxin [Pseudomonas tolaasii]
MYTDSEHRPVDGGGSSIVKELELTDLDIDQQLLGLPGISLLVFTGAGCSSCRWARQQLPGWPLPVDRVCWVDAGHNGGAVERYEIFHLPALFLVCEGQFLGHLHTRLVKTDLTDAIDHALTRTPEDLP